MNAQRHTPAPWYCDGYRIYAPTDSADKREGRVIVDFKHNPDFNPFDEPLLTNAPAILAALTQLAFMARTSGSPTPELLRACEGAEALIAKTEAQHG